MQTRGSIDFFLPSKVAYHVKIFLGGFLVTMIFNLMWIGNPFPENFLMIVGLVIVQLEVFMFIALKVFRRKAVGTGKQYKSKIITRLIFFYLLVFIIALAFVLLTIALSMLSSGGNFAESLRIFISVELRPFLITWFIGIAIGSMIFFYSEWVFALKREQKLKEENLIFQYETLKNQVNPHFLFNSLNTLASLVSRDAELSEKFITKFSSIYRYILENKDRESVKLSDEITFINNYFFLQKIRDDGKIDLQIEVDDPDAYEILPISLQLLVENALKHNAATKEKPLKICIALKNDVLVVENNLQKKMQIEPTSKIGLKNLKERISLVMKQELTVEESQEKFVVQLPVKKIENEGIDHRR